MIKQSVIASEVRQSPTYRAGLHSLGLPHFARNGDSFIICKQHIRKIKNEFLNASYEGNFVLMLTVFCQ